MRIALLLLVGTASPLFAERVSIPMVTVGNPNNASDTSGFGAVSTTYRIGKYEVTNGQFARFLNSVDPTGANELELYSPYAADSPFNGIDFLTAAVDGSKYRVQQERERNPVSFVSWFDAVRFVNWLHNGQGNGSTEDGAYTLLGGTTVPSNANSIVRNAGAKWFLPTQDEWYKAAYHKNDGASGNYWEYPTSSNETPDSDQPPGSDAPSPSNVANYWNPSEIGSGYNEGFAVTGSNFFLETQNYLSDVGAFPFATSPYGTFDQAGNLWEWNETRFGPDRGMRGGSWGETEHNFHSSCHCRSTPLNEGHVNGFRVAASIPEPSAAFQLLASGWAILIARRQFRCCRSSFQASQ